MRKQHEPEYKDCRDCGQARSRLDPAGVCAWCKLTVILCGKNPLLEKR
jgi:hypothetical protein